MNTENKLQIIGVSIKYVYGDVRLRVNSSTILLRLNDILLFSLLCHKITGTQSPPWGRACPRRARRAVQ